MSSVKITDYSKKKPVSRDVDHPNATQIEIVYDPGNDQYEVFFYDKNNVCLDQRAFRYTDRKDKRAERDRAINFARDQSPLGVTPKRTNF